MSTGDSKIHAVEAFAPDVVSEIGNSLLAQRYHHDR
jgi:hypothetical protein